MKVSSFSLNAKINKESTVFLDSKRKPLNTISLNIGVIEVRMNKLYP